MADDIALHEAGLPFEHEKVDLKAKRTENGAGGSPTQRLDMCGCFVDCEMNSFGASDHVANLSF